MSSRRPAGRVVDPTTDANNRAIAALQLRVVGPIVSLYAWARGENAELALARYELDQRIALRGVLVALESTRAAIDRDRASRATHENAIRDALNAGLGSQTVASRMRDVDAVETRLTSLESDLARLDADRAGIESRVVECGDRAVALRLRATVGERVSDPAATVDAVRLATRPARTPAADRKFDAAIANSAPQRAGADDAYARAVAKYGAAAATVAPASVKKATYDDVLANIAPS